MPSARLRPPVLLLRLVLLAVALSGRAAVGQAVGHAVAPAPPSAAAPALRFRHLGVDDGLPSAHVSDILRDRRGVMWFGTAAGVARYDGYRVRTYAHDDSDPASLPAGLVIQLLEDRAGALWVVTPGALSRYEPGRDRFTHFLVEDPATRPSGAPAREVLTVAEDSAGVLWVGTSRGLFTLDRRTGVARPYALPRPAYVMRLLAGRSGGVWVGTRTGLWHLRSAGDPAPRFHAHAPADPHALPDTLVLALAEDRAGDLWVGTGYGGAARLRAATGRFERFAHDPRNPNTIAKQRVPRLLPDRDGRGVWIGTENGGLDWLDPATRRVAHHRYSADRPSGIGSNSIWALHQGADGGLWVGTFSGGVDVQLPAGGAIRHHAAVAGDPTSLSYDAVPAFAEDPDGTVWVATDGGGLNHFDPRTGRFTRYTPDNSTLATEAVVGLLVDRAGTLWASAWGGGIGRFDRRTGRFRAYTFGTSNIPGINNYEFVQDRAGRYWLGAEGAEVVAFDPASGRFGRRFRLAPGGRALSSVLLLRELADGTFAAVVRDRGLAFLDVHTGAVARLTAGPGALASDRVYALLEERPGVLWVGSAGGLDRVERRGGAWARTGHWGPAEGLPGAAVMGVLPDAAGRLWLSGERGLARLDPRLPPGAPGAVRAYGRADGVQGGEFLMRSAFRARDGSLYFGGNQGFTVVRPELVADGAEAPAVAITGLQLFNRPVAAGAPGSPLARAPEATRALTLTHRQNVVTFEFAAPDYGAPPRTRYAYRLDGFDAGWQEVGAQHTAAYTNLAPGRYTFRVRATTRDGVWRGEGTAMDVTVTPPWWGTWWCRALAAAAALLAGWRWMHFRERRRVEVALGRQALEDPLTGLANRTLFRDRVDHALARLARAGPPAAGDAARTAVLFLDLDDFKTVNDSLGHHAGDALLRAVSARLLNATRGCDTVARLGGDEFAVLIENARGAADAHAVAGRIAQALRAPVPLDAAGPGAAGCEARVGVSVGIAFAEPGVDADALLRNADAAMYQAKAEGKGRHAVFDPALVAAAAERLELERDLAHALDRGEFSLAYQPIVALGTGAPAGAEALLRWRHPARGLVSPARFVPLAEASGLIVEVGRWVLDEACRAAAGWPLGAGGAPLQVAVNVSGRQLLHPALPAHVAGALAASGLAPGRLTLEITESVLMHDTAATLAVLHALKALGVRLAVDDFGTGYSSLRYLQQFPVDVLKIDKSFVDGVATAPHDAALARTIVTLGELLELRTVAEGVETAAQAERLRAMGCAYGQGYLFARPLDGAALEALLRAAAEPPPSARAA
jgi:diguanylate cyclase (GGDEF)-like protein